MSVRFMCPQGVPAFVQQVCCVAALFAASSCSQAADPPAGNLDLLKTFVAEFVEVRPGKAPFPPEFEMGSPTGPVAEQPAHKVTMAGPFAIAKYEVPQNLYEAIMGHNPSRWKGPRNSAESMTIRDARDFCSRITTALREANLIGRDELIRLPTEAEWEYCCRAGTATAYSFGDDAQREGDVSPKATLLDKYAWHTGNAAGNDPAVGVLAANPWGLYDMHGYLWEFCEDTWHETYEGAPATSFPEWKGEGRLSVVRGGSWKDSFELLRSSSRMKVAQAFRDDAIGFRCVKAKAVK